MKRCTLLEVLAELDVPPQHYAIELLTGLERCTDAVDAAIEASAVRWRLERMPAVDRAVLRIACYELLERKEVPTAVVIDEAVELVKGYSTEASAAFVNGVLASLASSAREPEL